MQVITRREQAIIDAMPPLLIEMHARYLLDVAKQAAERHVIEDIGGDTLKGLKQAANYPRVRVKGVKEDNAYIADAFHDLAVKLREQMESPEIVQQMAQAVEPYQRVLEQGGEGGKAALKTLLHHVPEDPLDFAVARAMVGALVEIQTPPSPGGKRETIRQGR